MACAVDRLRSAIRRSIAVGIVVVGGLAVIAVPAFAIGDVNQPGCPAATESSPGFRVSLPDCRAYEVVSEANSGDTANVVGSYGFPEGLRVYYKSFLPAPGAGARGGLTERFLATRTSAGWAQQAISSPQGAGPVGLSLAEQENAEGVIFTSDFAEAFVKSPFRDPFEEPQLNETTGMGAYRLSIDSGAVSLLSLPDSGVLTQEMIESPRAYASGAEVNGWGSFLVGGAADGSRAFFVTTAKLATAAGTLQDTREAGTEIYERAGGHTYLVGVLPDGSLPACGAEVGQGVSSTLNTQSFYSFGAVAPSGANVVFFTTGPAECNVGGLYLRDVVHGTTVQLPGSLFGGRAGTGAGEEEKIFTLGGGIHEYHVGTRETTEIGSGDLLTYSADGSRVYFLGLEEGIYVYHEGETKPIPKTQNGGYNAGVIGGGLIEGGGVTDYGQTRNMPVASAGESDGSHLLFVDSAQLTPYKNEGHFEAYVYDADTEAVTCISCDPRNEPPVGEVGKPGEGRAQLIDEFSTDIGEQQYQTPSPPLISEDGTRAVFETTEALVPQDVNGTMDVYEWEQVGSANCTEESSSYSPVIDGCVYMLSSGQGAEVLNENGIISGTHLVGASEGLRDVYMQTSESLLPGLDNASKLYDVRVDGGFPYTPPKHGCEAGQCRTSGGERAVFRELTTEGFSGPEDVQSSQKVSRPVQKRRLAQALRACRRHKGGRRRAVCERRARRRYRARASSGVRRRVGGESR